VNSKVVVELEFVVSTQRYRRRFACSSLTEKKACSEFFSKTEIREDNGV